MHGIRGHGFNLTLLVEAVATMLMLTRTNKAES
jgi:hypothetical protein